MTQSHKGLLVCVCALTVMTLTGCGSSSSKSVPITKKTADSKPADVDPKKVDSSVPLPASTPAAAVTPLGAGGSSLVGTWQTSCVSDSSGYHNMHSVFDASTDDEIISYYSDASCTQLSYKLEIKFSYVVAKASPADAMDLTVNSVSMTLNDATQISTNNSQSLCGHTDWAVGKVIDVTSCTAVNSHGAGSKYYTSYSIESGSLYFGSSSTGGDGSTLATRQKSVDKTVPYKSMP